MARGVTFNNYDLQDATVITNRAQHTQYPDRDLTFKRKTRADGFHIVNNYFISRHIVVGGTIKGADTATLHTNVDVLKKNLVGQNKNLDIDFNGTTRRYVATVESLDVPEDFYHLTFIPYTVTFLCSPFGKDTVSKSMTQISATITTTTGTMTFANGSAAPLPVITIKLTALSGSADLVRFTNQTTEEWVEVRRTFLLNDTIEIDVENQTVKVNGSHANFTGIFPSYVTDTNGYKLTVRGSGFTVTLDVEYTPLYL